MSYAISVSHSIFVATKYVLTCIAALIVLMLRDAVVVCGKVLPRQVLLYFFVGIFTLVVAWEIYLISAGIA